MTTRSIALVSVTLAFAATAAAAENTAKFEFSGDYTYMQYNPTISGLQSRALNGGGVGAQVNFGRWFGIKGDFQGFGSTTWTRTYTTPVYITNLRAAPPPVVFNPLSTTITIPAGTYSTNANMFTYMFGPTVSYHGDKFTVFSEVLMGGSNTSLYGGFQRSIDFNGGNLPGIDTQHPYTMAIGGGLDLNVHHHVAIRVAELDYILTRYTNPLTSTNNQNSFRYTGGVVFRFGGGL